VSDGWRDWAVRAHLVLIVAAISHGRGHSFATPKLRYCG
jgi:hypothetical protein